MDILSIRPTHVKFEHLTHMWINSAHDRDSANIKASHYAIVFVMHEELCGTCCQQERIFNDQAKILVRLIHCCCFHMVREILHEIDV